MNIPTQVSESFRRRNPHLYGIGKPNPTPADIAANVVFEKPTTAEVIEHGNEWIDAVADLNKTEREFHGILIRRHNTVLPHGLKLKLAGKTFYTPDFICFDHGLGVTIYEVKGGHIWDDAIVKLKCAANKFTAFRFILAQKKKGEWKESIVKP